MPDSYQVSWKTGGKKWRSINKRNTKKAYGNAIVSKFNSFYLISRIESAVKW